MRQQTIDFEALATAPNKSESTAGKLQPSVADASLPPPEAGGADTTLTPTPPLVRPDRQLVYEGTAGHYEWPDATELHDRDTITVDRVVDDIDGPAHRFVIKRGDTVEVFFRKGKLHVGQVTGISHARQEVRVSWDASLKKGGWFYKGKIYPAPEPEPTKPHYGKSLSSIIEEVNATNAPPGGWKEAELVPTTVDPNFHRRDSLNPPEAKEESCDTDSEIPTAESEWTTFTFAEFRNFWKASSNGTLSFDEYQRAFERLVASQEPLVSELISSHTAPQLKRLAQRMGDYCAKSNTKLKNAKSVYRKMLASFLLDDTVSFGMGESYTEAVMAKVRAVTEEVWQETHEQAAQAAADQAKRLADPQTLSDFSHLIQRSGTDSLTNEQMARWDSLHADLARQRRMKNGPTKTVLQFEASELEGYEFRMIEGYHTKRECKLWIVQLSSRVERATFNELNGKAKMLRGRFSSFQRDEAGFQFYDLETATRFTELLGGDTDRSDILRRRQERRELTAAERLHELADTTLERADATITASEQSLQNTARRAGIQAGVRGQAYADQALARSLHSVAEALSTGEATYLDGIRHKTHLEALDTTLYLAKWARIREIRKAKSEQEYGYGLRVQEEEEKPHSEDDVRFAEYPQPVINKRQLENAINEVRGIKGSKMISERMSKRIRRVSGDHVTFTGDAEIAQLADFLSRAKAAGYDTQWMDKSIERYKRLQAAHLGDAHELRAALREYLPHKASVRGDDPVQIAERELIGKKLPGFFPTPKVVILQMLELADLQHGQRLLEPSCGKGDILDALRETELELAVYAIEQNLSLAEVLGAKGYAVDYTDFLAYHGEHERIVMNPPFEKGRDIDHVRHAFNCLASGGRLVSVMSEGPFFRSDKKSVQFRRWFDSLGGDSLKLPEEAFQGTDAFRQTGVRTRLVVLDKEKSLRFE